LFAKYCLLRKFFVFQIDYIVIQEFFKFRKELAAEFFRLAVQYYKTAALTIHALHGAFATAMHTYAIAFASRTFFID
jgi:hypothetical protein